MPTWRVDARSQFDAMAGSDFLGRRLSSWKPSPAGEGVAQGLSDQLDWKRLLWSSLPYASPSQTAQKHHSAVTRAALLVAPQLAGFLTLSAKERKQTLAAEKGKFCLLSSSVSVCCRIDASHLSHVATSRGMSASPQHETSESIFRESR